MKRQTTKHEKIKQKIARLETELRNMAHDKEQREQELERYTRRHKSLLFDSLETRDTEKLKKIYAYFDKKYPIDFQGGLRCDERGMRLVFWLDKDPDFLILHLTSTSENICFSGSTSWQVKAATLADKIETLKQIKKDIQTILK